MPARPEQRSAAATVWRRWYKSKHWRQLRAEQLERQPLCQCPHCQAGKRRITKADTVNHRRPHKGNRRLFFDPNNLMSVAKACHDGPIQSVERGGVGFLGGCDEQGLPLDPSHHWNDAAFLSRRG